MSKREFRMEARSATSKDLAKVFRNLAGRMVREYEVAGLTKRAAKDAFLKKLKAGRGDVIIDGDEPIAIIVWDEEDGKISTSFAAQERFFTGSIATIRFCRKHLSCIQQKYDDLPVRSYSWSKESSVKKWFEVLGFQEVVDGDVYRVFELPSSCSKTDCY